MKFKGNLIGAGICLAIFLAFAIAGGICLASGFAEIASNPEIMGELQDVVESFGDYNFVDFDGDVGRETSASYERELRSDVEKIVIADSGCDVIVRNGSEFSVTYNGKVRSSAFDSDGGKVVDTENSADYYEQDGAIKASFKNGVLTVSVDTVNKVGIVNFGSIDLGEMTVTVPASYAGSLELNSVFGECDITGLSFDELIFDKCAGEIAVYGCDANMLVITDLAGEVDVEEGSKILGISIEDIAGEVNITTAAVITADSMIRNVAGEVNIDVPANTQLNVERSSVLGSVIIDREIGGGSDAPAMEIDSVMGEVTIEIDD